MGLWEHLAVFVLPLVPVSENSALIWALLGGMYGRCVIEDYFPSIFSLPLSLSLILQPTQTFLCGLTPECVQVSCLTLSKESGGWKEAHSSTPAFEQAHMKPHTHTHTLAGTDTLSSCREEDKMSGLVLGDNCWCCCRHGDRCGVGLQQKTAVLKFT